TEREAGRVPLGAEARIILDALPQYVIPAKVSFVSSVAQFTPKSVETRDERQKLMFRTKVRIDPELLNQYIEYVKTGVPGVAYIRLDPESDWLTHLEVQLPASTSSNKTANTQYLSMQKHYSPVVVTRGLLHRYGDTLVLNELSLDLPRGVVTGIIGPDGVGKSTLLGLIAGARKIQQGELQVLDVDMRDKATREANCARIAYMPQGLGRNLYPTLSVFENIDFFARLFGQNRQERHTRIKELLASTGMSEFADRPAQKLSGGMKQK